MAKLETASIVASSLDNFIVFNNDIYMKPYVDFNIGQPNGHFYITIKDAYNTDGYSKKLDGLEDGELTNSSFSTTGDEVQFALNLMECLRMNSIFIDIALVNNNNRYTVRAYIETSTKYEIKSSDETSCTIGGNYSSYNVKYPNKFVMMLWTSEYGNITMEKYSTSEDVSFNITSPFIHMSLKTPTQAKIMAYRVSNGVTQLENITNNVITILPTTLSKFQSIDYDLYFMYNEINNKVKFLTNNFNRVYNYGEKVSLSILTDSSNVSLIKKYYTNSGVFLDEDSDIELTERNNIRTDFYFSFDLDSVEQRNGSQVGYIEVIAKNNGVEVSEPVRYNVIPKCNENHEIFFVDEIGGIDSFNFLGEYIFKSSIDEHSTYIINPTRPFADTLELEHDKQKRNNITKTLTSTIIDSDTAYWLNELSKSKYVFKYFGNNMHKFMVIIVDDIDIQISDREKTFEIAMKYHDGDNAISI
jgi:hypothetical protein